MDVSSFKKKHTVCVFIRDLAHFCLRKYYQMLNYILSEWNCMSIEQIEAIIYKDITFNRDPTNLNRSLFSSNSIHSAIKYMN